MRLALIVLLAWLLVGCNTTEKAFPTQSALIKTFIPAATPTDGCRTVFPHPAMKISTTATTVHVGELVKIETYPYDMGGTYILVRARKKGDTKFIELYGGTTYQSYRDGNPPTIPFFHVESGQELNDGVQILLRATQVGTMEFQSYGSGETVEAICSNNEQGYGYGSADSQIITITVVPSLFGPLSITPPPVSPTPSPVPTVPYCPPTPPSIVISADRLDVPLGSTVTLTVTLKNVKIPLYRIFATDVDTGESGELLEMDSGGTPKPQAFLSRNFGVVSASAGDTKLSVDLRGMRPAKTLFYANMTGVTVKDDGATCNPGSMVRSLKSQGIMLSVTK